MKYKIYLMISICLLAVVLVGCTNSEVTPNGDTKYNQVTLSVDETNLYKYIGTTDYIFIGTVEKVIENIVDSDFPQIIYQIKVNENLKGNLVDTVRVKKNGGYDKKGTLILNETDQTKDSGIPEVNKQYIFIAYGQPDGSLVLAPINGNLEVTDDLVQNYKEYIKNEIKEDRVRFTSIYDKEAVK